ncbi:MAG TPA: amidohydrolase [Nitrososphaerales archaeon]|nr:amidohydrolase [Nitrososphaerales archaeon]
MTETTLIEDGIVFTMDGNKTVLDPGYLVVQDNRIVEVASGSPKSSDYKIDVKLDAKHKAVLPGLVDSHYHSIALHRGGIDGLLAKGMSKAFDEFYYPMLARMTPEDVYNEAMLAYLECLKSGITTVNDMYRHITACADAAEKIGIRAIISSEAADLVPGQESLSDNENAFNAKNGAAEGRVTIWFGAEWIPICSPEFFSKAKELADKHGTGLHIHLAESLDEVELSKKKYGKRPGELMFDLDALGSNVLAAHCVWLSDKEIRLLKETGTAISTCPISNLKLGNGIARLHDMILAGLRIGIGTDAYMNNFDMFDAMKYASILQKGSRADASSLPGFEKAFSMATIEGAGVLGLEREIGSLEKGKKADIILVDLDQPKFQPLLRGKFDNLLPNIVYGAHGENVDTVFVDGKLLVENRKVRGVDEKEIFDNALKSAERVNG